MSSSEWYASNRKALMERVGWIKKEPNGVLCEKQSDLHRIVIVKSDDLLRMCFVDPAGSGEELTSSGAMSALSLEDPVDLSPTPYNQAFMLTLLLRNRPERIYVAGFGGGRVPLAFHHHFPHAVIDSTEIDVELPELARKYFAVEYDRRQRLHLMDSRKFLEIAGSPDWYDLMFIDAFRGGGNAPAHLATMEFYRACRMRLNPGGVVAVNLVESDPLFGQRMATLVNSFESTYVHIDRTTVVFCVDAQPVCSSDLSRRAGLIQQEHNFAFDFIQRASALKPLAAVERLWTMVEQNAILTDLAFAGFLAAN